MPYTSNGKPYEWGDGGSSPVTQEHGAQYMACCAVEISHDDVAIHANLKDIFVINASRNSQYYLWLSKFPLSISLDSIVDITLPRHSTLMKFAYVLMQSGRHSDENSFVYSSQIEPFLPQLARELLGSTFRQARPLPWVSVSQSDCHVTM